MKFLQAVVIMSFALFLLVMTAPSRRPSTPGHYASRKLISSLTKHFKLAVLAADRKKRINLKASHPVVVHRYGNLSGVNVSILLAGLANDVGTEFSLKNGRLITNGTEASFLSRRPNFNLTGLQSFIFFPDERTRDYNPINFTAVETSDSYGRTFLRLGGDDGEFLLKDTSIDLNIFYHASQ